jgi:hypothetical protein
MAALCLLSEVRPRILPLWSFSSTPLRKLGQFDAGTVGDWTSILKQSTEWEFVSLRKEAIYQLSHTASPIDLLVLSHTFNVPEWRIPAYASLSRRPAPLSTGEARRLPVDDVTTIYALREYNTTDSRKFRAVLSTLGMYFVSYHACFAFVAWWSHLFVKDQPKLNCNPTKTLPF